MSEFIDRLVWVSQVVPQPMGFRVTLVHEKPKLLLIGSLAQADISGLADYMAGADAGLLRISDLDSGAETLQDARKIVPEIPWGGWLKGVDWEATGQTVKVDCDFLVFPAANTSLAVLQNDKVGRILEVEASLGEGLLRAVNELPVGAVLLASEQGEGDFLTWRHLMLFQRFADVLAKPLLVSVPSNVTGSELQTLWEAGVGGVIVEVGVGQPVERLKELRQEIDRLTFSSPRRRGKVEALLPHISEETSPVTEEEEEEE